jgi:hypothetical protein
MRHRIEMILAAIMTRALFFPGVWGTCLAGGPGGYLRLLRFPPRQASLADFGECNGCLAFGVSPMWPMFRQQMDALREHRSMTCELDRPCRVVLLAAEGRVS